MSKHLLNSNFKLPIMKNLISIFVVILILNACQSGILNKERKTSDTKLSLDNTVYKKKESPQNPCTENFNKAEYGSLPAYWSNIISSTGKSGSWSVVNDNGNNVIAQTSEDNPTAHFNLVVNDTINMDNIEIHTKFKGIKGKIDQGGGPVWRFVDAKNYYIARANPLEDNYRVYKVVGGRRQQLQSADFVTNPNQWHKIKITMNGNEIKCWLDDVLLLKTTDNTFPGAGKAGLWTKADAVTYFDDFKIQSFR